VAVLGLNETGINLNPYQGLKRDKTTQMRDRWRRNQPKSLSAIETHD
jgi:hypothetical protein